MGSGTMTPLSVGASGLGIALPYTLLSLPRYARIMGISPVHFQGAYGDGAWPVMQNACENLWPRFSWQYSDMVSHDELAHTILSVEEEIANILGYWPAPKWVAQEMHQFPQYYRQDMKGVSGWNVQLDRKSVQARWGKIILGGQRALTLIQNASIGGGELVYTDEDSDGFYETCTITVPTTLTDVCEIKLYHTGTSGDEWWEIRPVRSKSISGGNVTIVLDAWLMIDPELLSAPPTDAGFQAVNLETTANFVTSVDVYREYTDNSTTGAVFYWEPKDCAVCGTCTDTTDTGTCTVCGLVTQSGCLHIRDVGAGHVVPTPATYDEDEADWVVQDFSVSRDPDMVKIYYLSGMTSERYNRGLTCEPLDDVMARVIAHMATARLERDLCQCGNVTALSKYLREDLAHVGEVSTFVTPEIINNPFGTKRGEVNAWNYISKMGLIDYGVATL